MRKMSTIARQKKFNGISRLQAVDEFNDLYAPKYATYMPNLSDKRNLANIIKPMQCRTGSQCNPSVGGLHRKMLYGHMQSKAILPRAFWVNQDLK